MPTIELGDILECKLRNKYTGLNIGKLYLGQLVEIRPFEGEVYYRIFCADTKTNMAFRFAEINRIIAKGAVQ